METLSDKDIETLIRSGAYHAALANVHSKMRVPLYNLLVSELGDGCRSNINEAVTNSDEVANTIIQEFPELQSSMTNDKIQNMVSLIQSSVPQPGDAPPESGQQQTQMPVIDTNRNNKIDKNEMQMIQDLSPEGSVPSMFEGEERIMLKEYLALREQELAAGKLVHDIEVRLIPSVPPVCIATFYTNGEKVNEITNAG